MLLCYNNSVEVTLIACLPMNNQFQGQEHKDKSILFDKH